MLLGAAFITRSHIRVHTAAAFIGMYLHDKGYKEEKPQEEYEKFSEKHFPKKSFLKIKTFFFTAKFKTTLKFIIMNYE